MSDRKRVKALLFVALSLPILNCDAVQAQQAGGEIIQVPGLEGSPFGQVRLPRILNNPIVPTDVTGPGGGLGHARGVVESILGPEPRGLNIDSRSVRRNPRFAYGGVWCPFNSDRLALSQPAAETRRSYTWSARPNLIADNPAAASDIHPVPVYRGRIPVPGNGVFLMPTKDCRYTRLTDNEILLDNGGVLVKTTSGSVIISAQAGAQKVMTVIEKGTLALVSTFDNNVSVTTFIANKHKDVGIYLPRPDGKTHELHVPVGTEADVFAKESQALPFNILMANGRRMAREQLVSGARVHTYEFDYPRALRYYGMSNALPAKDYDRLLHVAAAVTVATHR